MRQFDKQERSKRMNKTEKKTAAQKRLYWQQKLAAAKSAYESLSRRMDERDA